MNSYRDEIALEVAKNKPNLVLYLLTNQNQKGWIQEDDAREFQKQYIISSHYRRSYPILGAIGFIGLVYPFAPKNIAGCLATLGLGAWLGTKVGSAVARNSQKVQRAEEEQNLIVSKYADLLKDPKVILSLNVLKR